VQKSLVESGWTTGSGGKFLNARPGYAQAASSKDTLPFTKTARNDAVAWRIIDHGRLNECSASKKAMACQTFARWRRRTARHIGCWDSHCQNRIPTPCANAAEPSSISCNPKQPAPNPRQLPEAMTEHRTCSMASKFGQQALIERQGCDRCDATMGNGTIPPRSISMTG